MLVTDIKKIDKAKSYVCIDYEYGFALYNSELHMYNITVNCDIEKSVLEEIYKILKKRCNERAGYILSKSDKSIYEFKDKLRHNYYPDEIIDLITKNYISYGYLDDERYANNYVKNYSEKKSINKIRAELTNKKIDKDIIEQSICKIEKDIDEMQYKIIEKEFNKKRIIIESQDKNKINKIITSLIRKGFLYEDIMRVYRDMFGK